MRWGRQSKSFYFNGRGINPVPVILFFNVNEICAPAPLYTIPVLLSIRKIHKTTAIFLPTFGYFANGQTDLFSL